ncbi:hypothetical protein IMCC12053_603 [Celeribacter marinus]|uniref:Uncharacterized protein n=2 Tax=Celeribacter marinus TaxID=1397108 RepID=A0A0P0A9N2_9RHOB|nr:hypothetical protein IMCC12053_603 [Celeribacter marinus]
MFWLIRAKRWAKHPPSTKRIIFVFGIVAACVVLYLIERAGLLPEWMQLEGRGGMRF